MPKKFPPEFKGDVVTVARRGDLSVAEVGADFDISVESVRRQALLLRHQGPLLQPDHRLQHR